MACSAGVDLYVDDEVTSTSRHYRTFFPPYDTDGHYESILYFPTRKPRYITLHLPLYSSLNGFEVGLQEDATVDHGLAYRPIPPVVYYGSSITQGGCASRPGNAYTNVVSRRINIDHINLGFSGNAKGESAIVDYMAGLTMSAFVCDYDHNAPSVDHLRATHEPLYRAIRAAHPDIPYVMMTRPDFDGDRANSALRRDVVYETYRRALSEGDRNVYFIDGERLLSGPYLDMATVDGCHPTDLGFALMADAVTDVLTRALSVSNA
jgi:lysophospholipase L1-like esterase